MEFTKKIHLYAFCLLVVLQLGLLSSCSENALTVGTRNALGVTNELVVVSSDELWEGWIGDTLRYYYESAYPVMPQPEPLFDLRHITPERLSQNVLLKELRNYLFIGNLERKDSPTSQLIKNHLQNATEDFGGRNYASKVLRDKWADGQQLVYLFANSDDALVQGIAESFPAISKRVRAFDEKQIDAATYLEGVNRALSEEVVTRYGVDLKIPRDFQKVRESENMIWLRKDLDEAILNMMILQVPYRSEAQFEQANLKKLRDSLGRKYVSSPEPGSYMVTNDQDLPMFVNQLQVNGNFAVEARGIWEMENDFLGGPFLSYAFLSPDGKSIIFIDNFVFAPGKKKRNYIQQLEHIISSIRYKT